MPRVATGYPELVTSLPSKVALRQVVRERISQLSVSQRSARSAQVVEWLRPRVAAGTILAFMPLPDEVDIVPLLVGLAASGRLVLPRVVDGGIVLHRVANLDALRVGPMRLREPAPNAVEELPEDIDVALIPGLAFTRDGGRLGRGKGMYDRLLPRLRPEVPRIGIAFAEQIVDELPLEPHDIRLSAVVPVFE